MFTLISNHEYHGTGRVGRVADGVFHVDGGADNADLDKDDGWLDMGAEEKAEKKDSQEQKVSSAQNEVISDAGREKLPVMLLHYDIVIKLTLDAGPLADIEPLKVHLKTNAIPVRATQRRYPEAKREFMTRYVGKLLEIGFVVEATSPEWVSESLIAPKRPPAMYRLTIDYRRVNSATTPTFWPMPNIAAELSDTRGSTAFAGI